MLEVGNRAVGIRKGSLEMGQDLGCRGLIGRRTTRRERRADFALAQDEAAPEALPGPATSPAVGDGTACRGDVAGDSALQESPQPAGSDAQTSDFVSKPYAEGATTTGTPMAVAAKNPPSANGLALGVAFVVTVQKAMAIQRANRFAMRTRRLLEPFRNRVPFLLVAAKPALFAHACPTPRENR
jgi:hypothetical protein